MMSESTGYNGWSNYETWTVNLWLTNDRYFYDELCSILKKGTTPNKCADMLEQWVRNECEFWGDEASIWSDLLNDALSRVDWLEIIQNNL